MIKVLRIINRFNLGGPTYNAANLTKFLPEDFETLLVGGEKDESEASSLHITQKLDLNPTVIPEMKRSISPKSDYQAYKAIDKIIKEYKPDIVHTHAAKSGALGRLAAWNNGVPGIVHTFHGHVFHSYFNPVKTRIFKAIERNLARKSHAIVAISNLQQKELVEEHRIAPANKFRVIRLGFELQKFQENLPEKRKQFRTKWRIAEDEKLIVIVGRLVPVKNHKLFLDAVAEIFKSEPAAKFKAMIVGDGELRDELTSYCQQIGLSLNQIGKSEIDKQIIFTSWEKDVDIVYAGADIVALSSFNEGTPVSLIEAQAAGLPIVTTNVGGVENVVLPNKNARLCDSEDLSGFVSGLNFWLSKPELESAGNLGVKHAFDQFGYQRLSTEMAALYKDILNEKSR